MVRVDRVCIIGAGSSGIASCQVLAARDINFDCFEKGSGVGGNWRYENDNGMSSAYASLHINTSRNLMAYASYPMPEHYPDYPHHAQIADYFDSYVDHFGLRERIEFNTEVVRVEPAREGWDVTVRGPGGSEETRSYGAVMVANGHHWDARWPEPSFPGQDSFAGEQIHSHDYKTADGYEDKDVLVVGMGNSAMDIAVETSRVSRMTWLSARRGAWIFPKYLKGKPVDELSGPLTSRLPLAFVRAMYGRLLRQAQGHPTDYGLPEPDHKLAEAHPTISAEILSRIGHGRVTPKPNIERIDGDTVNFVDGSSQRIDRIVWCTGYKIAFPFFDEGLISAPDNEIPLFRRVVSPEHPGLYFIGLLQPLGAIMPLAEAQSGWIADVLEGGVPLPERAEMERVIERERERMRKRYVASKRHTIQVDFYDYLRAVRRERKRRRGRLAALQAARSHELRVGTPV